MKELEQGVDSSSRDYAVTIKSNNSISVCFYIEQDKPFAIGEQMAEINEDAYMNGYNWEAFFSYYLSTYAPEVGVGMKTDPEAGMYVAYYTVTPENEARAERFVEIIYELMENEQVIYEIVRNEGKYIEWD